MAWVATAVVAAFEVTSVATVLTAISAVGMATTVVGAVTDNKNLMKIGGEISMVGGIGGLVNGAIGAAAGGAAEGLAATGADAAIDSAGKAVLSGATDDVVTNMAGNGLVADTGSGLAGLGTDAGTMASGAPAMTSTGAAGGSGLGAGPGMAGNDFIGSQQNMMGMNTDMTGAVNPPDNFVQPVFQPAFQPLSQTVAMQGTGSPSLDVGGNVVGANAPGPSFNTDGTINTTTNNKFAVSAEDLAGGLDKDGIIPVNDLGQITGYTSPSPSGSPSGALSGSPSGSPSGASSGSPSLLDNLGSKWSSMSDAQKLEFTKSGLALPFNIMNQRNQQAALDFQRQKQAQTSYGSDVPRFGIINSIRRT
ncbi:hypothetical protein ACO0K9_12215 [Undibacterium sp. Ji50W]|uniref:hypothetical protein n=1 Tax=Undibacterium sp. Ji50W TaxID=3413041 RepID=UPI003BF43B56